MLEDRLRDAYRAAAETVRPETLPPNATLSRGGHGRRQTGPTGQAHRGRSRRRVLIPAAAAVAVVAVAATVSVLLPRAMPSIGGRGPASNQPTSAIVSTPGYFVGLNWTQHPSMFVVNATTGAQGAQISLPFPATELESVATGDGQTFVVAASPPNSCSTSLYRFSLAGDGTPSAMTLFTKVTGVIEDPWSMAVSANGQVIAYDTMACGPQPNSFAQQQKETGYLSVLGTVTGQAKQWTFRNSQVSGTGNVSISANGSVVGFANEVIDTSAAPGSVAARGRVVATDGEFGPPVSFNVSSTPGRTTESGPSVIIGGLNVAPDGKTVYFETNKEDNVDKPVWTSWQLRAFDLATGQTSLVRSFPGTEDGPAAVTFDPTGRYMLVESAVNTGSATKPVAATKLTLVNVATGQLTPLNASWAVDPEIAW